MLSVIALAVVMMIRAILPKSASDYVLRISQGLLAVHLGNPDVHARASRVPNLRFLIGDGVVPTLVIASPLHRDGMSAKAPAKGGIVPKKGNCVAPVTGSSDIVVDVTQFPAANGISTNPYQL
jgi:hypothetical protein